MLSPMASSMSNPMATLKPSKSMSTSLLDYVIYASRM